MGNYNLYIHTQCNFITMSARESAQVLRASSRSFSNAGRPSIASEIGTSDAAMAIDFLTAMAPPLRPATLAALKSKLPQEPGISLSVLAQLGLDGLKELTGIDSIVERARILAAIGNPETAFAPPPLGPHGEPVIVRPKIGFTQLSQCVDRVRARRLHTRPPLL